MVIMNNVTVIFFFVLAAPWDGGRAPNFTNNGGVRNTDNNKAKAAI